MCETRYRGNLVDMHIPDWNEEFLSRFDSTAYVDLIFWPYTVCYRGHCRRRFPERSAVAFVQRDGYAEFELPRLDTFLTLGLQCQ